jgi:nucleoside-diphosphate-sugar epimerase
MSKKILITGISGFIGKHTARLALESKKAEITGMIRPGTNPSRVNEFNEKIKFAEIDLTDIPTLRNYLKDNNFDVIIHIGALRGGRKNSNHDFLLANVNSTEQFIINAQQNNSKLIFCSSVGVFGAIPSELPANNHTKRREDNYYHKTKIYAENLIQKYVLYGLNAAVIRPAITYGIGDYGFPFTLTKLVEKKLMFYPNHPVHIHLTNINLLAQSFIRLADNNFKTGVQYNIADKEPVKLSELVNFISNELHGCDYSRKPVPQKYFELAEKIARSAKSELWVSRLELISKSWYYETHRAYKELQLKPTDTIPSFKLVTDWYKNK